MSDEKIETMILEQAQEQIRVLNANLFFMKRELLKRKFSPDVVRNAKHVVCAKMHKNLQYIWPDKQFHNVMDRADFDFIPDLALMFGEDECPENEALASYAFKLGLPVLVAENGFLRGVHFFTWKTKDDPFTDGYSFIIDTTQYYDATSPNSVEDDLNSYEVTEDQKHQASETISKIVSLKLSKYNDQPRRDLGYLCANKRPKVLVIDQAFSDLSIIKGYATEGTFRRMLDSALAENPDADVIIKTHPEGNAGQRIGYYGSSYDDKRIIVFNQPVNPYDLLNICDKVYVCSSQMGFEALMAGKEVHTFGMPVYAGWGLTKDALVLKRRHRTLTLEEFFYIFYIRHTIYVDPAQKKPCSIDRAIEIISSERERYFKSLAQK